MAHDIISDGLNQVMNSKKAGKQETLIKRYSKVLASILEVAKREGYLDYDLDNKNKVLKIKVKKMNECKAIKPRFNVKIEEIDKYVRRYLPARDFGVILISTNQGILTQKEAYEKNIGGSLIAYFY